MEKDPQWFDPSYKCSKMWGRSVRYKTLMGKKHQDRSTRSKMRQTRDRKACKSM